MTRPADITLTIVKATDWLDRLAPLFDDHKAEVEAHISRPWAPAREVYRAYEASNTYVAAIASLGEEIIGYAGGFIYPHPHYAPARWLTSDVLFIAKPHRSAALTWRLIRTIEAEAVNRGCVVTVWGAKPGSPLAALLGRKRRIEDTLFLKEL